MPACSTMDKAIAPSSHLHSHISGVKADRLHASRWLQAAGMGTISCLGALLRTVQSKGLG